MAENGNGNGNGNGRVISAVIATITLCSAGILALGAAVRQGDQRDAERTAQMVLELHNRFAQFDYERGKTDKAIAALELKAKELDEVLQREMRLINDATVTSVDGIDRRLQGEIRTWVDDHARQIQEMRELSRFNRDLIHGVKEDLARMGVKP